MVFVDFLKSRESLIRQRDRTGPVFCPSDGSYFLGFLEPRRCLGSYFWGNVISRILTLFVDTRRVYRGDNTLWDSHLNPSGRAQQITRHKLSFRYEDRISKPNQQSARLTSFKSSRAIGPNLWPDTEPRDPSSVNALSDSSRARHELVTS